MNTADQRLIVKSEDEVHYNNTCPHWIKAEDNPFGVEILDCRGTFKVKVSDILRGLDDIENDPASAKSLRKVRKLHPDFSFEVVCNLTYPLSSGQILPEGLIAKPSDSSQKWYIFNGGKDLIFYDVYAGNVMYRARFRQENNSLRIRFIEAHYLICRYSPSMAVANLDFIIKSSLFGIIVPHPIPSCIPREVSKILSHNAFTFDGRAVFATYEDTLSIDWLNLERF